ncbi:hypothetical protein ACWEOZ_32935 [Actinoplanes sp. NPDC004185]
MVQGEAVTPQFVVWPAGAPAQRSAWSSPALAHPGTVFTTVPSTLVDGGRYHLKARATDAVSAWSPICTFTVDTTRPHPPTVTSADYPEGKPGGGAGVTGKFTFAVAGGDKDVVKFRYSSESTGLLEVPAGRGGRATVEITPDRYGTSVVTVQAIDRTGNRSAETTYSFTVIDRAPKVLDQNADAGPGVPRTIRFWSAVPGTASFTYRFNDGPATTVDADADGYGATTVTSRSSCAPIRRRSPSSSVRSTSARPSRSSGPTRTATRPSGTLSPGNTWRSRPAPAPRTARSRTRSTPGGS